MEQPKLVERYLLLYVPWFISLILSYTPALSFMASWLGSFYIFYLSYSGKIKHLPTDLLLQEQLMRPVFLVQIIFAGYMSVTPIFNFLAVIDWINMTDYINHKELPQLELIAQGQRFYCLGHAAYTMGILIFMDSNPSKRFNLIVKDFPTFLVGFTLVAFISANTLIFIPGLRQFYFQLSSLSFIAGTLALIYSFRAGRLEFIVICSILFIINMIQSLFSGYKEPVIINILVLGIFLFPFYKKLVLLFFIPVILALFYVLPTYNQVFREKAWTAHESAESATDAALEAITNEEEIEDSTTWGFLTGRLSEVQMFTVYMENTPSLVDYYGFDIILQAFEVVIPRAFWPDKPITEKLVMERVYKSGVVNSNSNVSAKPALVVDGYLSGGTLGVFLTCLIFGATTQLISMKAEQLFGGYLLGTAIIFSGLFQILWRGLTFEFLVNSVFWSYVTMYVIFLTLRFFNLIKKADEDLAD